MSRPLVVLFAFCCGVIVANLYYAQPILDLIAPDVGLSRDAASLVVSMTQIGYALGLFFIVPLADLVENKRLLIVTVVASVLCLGAAAFASRPHTFLAVSLLVGVSSVAVQVLIPLAAHLAPEATRGRIVGNVMSGLMLGILLSRPFASLVADHFGWRAVFWAAAALMLAMVAILAATMPKRRPVNDATYVHLIRSLGTLLARFPTLRQRAFYQACMFGTFSLFWAAVPLELVRNHGYSQSQVAVFALIGAMGAVAAPIGGRLADAGHARIGTGIAIALCAVAWLAGLANTGVAMLAVTAVLVDFCVQLNMTIGQREIFALDARSRARMNALYMTSLFIGGAFGSSLASVLYARGGWPWIVAAGVAFPVMAFLRFLVARSAPAPTPRGLAP